MNRGTTFARSAAIVAFGVLAASTVTAVAQGQDAKELFQKNCVTCHGASGKGDGPAGKMLKPAPADFAVVLKGKSDADILKVVKEGGKAAGKSAAMPAYGSRMSDEQMQGVVQYIKGLK